MGKADIITKQYMQDNAVFADAFNFLLYGGQLVIQPEKLHVLDAVEVEVPYGADKATMPTQKARDELKYLAAMTDEQAAYVVLGIENQHFINYAMPVKNMVYDALQYAGQVRKAADSHKKAKDTAGYSSDEYLSGFYKDDKLIPVVTLVMFFSAESWDGPLSLYDMLNTIDEGILSMIDNYRIHMIAPENLSNEDLKKFRTNLREVLEFIKYSKDKEKLNEIISNNTRYTEMDRKAVMVIETCTGTDFNIDEKEGAINVCQAILDMKMEERMIGREEGRAEGHTEGYSEGVMDNRIKMILNLMDSMQCTAEKAMDILKIPENIRQQCLDRLAE